MTNVPVVPVTTVSCACFYVHYNQHRSLVKVKYDEGSIIPATLG